MVYVSKCLMIWIGYFPGRITLTFYNILTRYNTCNAKFVITNVLEGMIVSVVKQKIDDGIVISVKYMIYL